MLTRKDDNGKRRVIGKSSTRQRETPDFGKMVARMLRSYGRRVANADEVDLAQMLEMRAELDRAIVAAVHGQRTIYKRSWAYIAEGAGITRQAAQQRWGKAVAELDAEQADIAESNEPARLTLSQRIGGYCLDCNQPALKRTPDSPFMIRHADGCTNTMR